MRSPRDMDIVVLDITNRCFLACSNCTRLISHQVKTHEMSPETLRKSLASLKGWYRPGRVIGLIGGEPTLHSQFSELCRILREEWNPGQDTTHGRQPIADFNAFAEQRLHDRRNGRGLWTSFGPRFMDHYEAICDTFSHWNPNDHSAGGKHQTGLVDAREMCKSLGIAWEDWPKWRNSCWVQTQWSASVTPQGKAYFCEYAAQLDTLYNEGKRGWDIETDPNWWKRTPDQFGDQLDICEMCSLCLPGPSQVDALDRDILSENHRVRLELVGSPAVKKGRFDLYDPAKHQEQRQVTTKDSYVAGQRVSDDNASVKPKHVACVVVCVGRAEHLKHTLAHNAKFVDQMIVVTTGEDIATQRVIGGMTEGPIETVISDSCYADQHAFNKGRMINAGLERINKPDWIVLTDADCFLNPKLPEFIKTHAINPGVLHGSYRYDWEEDVIKHGGPPRGSFDGAYASPASATGVNAEPNGYFQLFNPRAAALADSLRQSLMSEEFCSAGGVDSWFMQQWPKDKRVLVPELAVVHIAHGNFGQGWSGDRPGWRQMGMLTGKQFFVTEQMQGVPRRLRLTDTLHGRSVEIDWIPNAKEFPLDVVRPDGKGGLIFLGEDIGAYHVVIAYLKEKS